MDRTTSSGHRARRTALLAASAMALVFATAPERAAAQGFQGSGAVPAGAGGAIIDTGATTITVTGARTVINWAPTDTSGPAVIDFLPADNSARFQSNLTDYTVLNRILPSTTSMIGLNGTITSTVSDGVESQIPGGNVWFYTPYGFVVGGGASISVGGLILTTNDITFGTDGSGNATFTDANGAITFRGSAGSKAPVIINPGASITAGSYIAMVAPRIEQHGSVTADRSIAYVAGEMVDLTVNAGNFDIVVGQGTTDAEGIVHTGSTTVSQTTGVAKTISFIAIPKNDALTMMLSGAIGYEPADSVILDGSSIVLQAGDEGTPSGNIQLGAGDYGIALSAQATGDITVAGSGGPLSETIRFQGNAFLYGDNSVSLVAGSGVGIVAEQSLFLDSRHPDGNGGTILVRALPGVGQAPAGSIAVTNGLFLTANGFGAASGDGMTGNDATGGSVTLSADGGTIGAGYIFGDASGRGGDGSVQSGDGFGGAITMTAGYGGTISSSFVSLRANGSGGFSTNEDSAIASVAGDGHGGTVTVADSGVNFGPDATGGLFALGALDINTTGDGGYTYGIGRAGNAFGGGATVTIDHQSQRWGSLYVQSDAFDGNTSYDPIGGTIDMTVGGGVTLALAGELFLTADAIAGLDGGPGAFGQGGMVNLTVNEGATLSVGSTSRLSAEATIGTFFGTAPDSSPDLTGGTVKVSVDGEGSLFQTRDLYLSTDAYNIGAMTSSGFAKGGSATVEASNLGQVVVSADDGFGGFFQVSSSGYGTLGPAATSATGGQATVAALTGGSITATDQTIELFANAGTSFFSESGGSGVNAVGGTIAIDAIGGTIGSPVLAEAYGDGGDGSENGGSGTGGTIALRVLEGGTFASSLGAYADGTGGYSYSTGDGGTGTGGHLSILTDATAQFPDFTLGFQANGRGGDASVGTAGDAYGGTAQIDVIGGTHSWSNVSLSTDARGGESTGSDSVAGSAFGGENGVRIHVGGDASLTIFNGLSIDATAHAGFNGGANQSVGGTIDILVDGGATLTTGYLEADASAGLIGSEFDPFSVETSPTAQGGSVSVVADGGTISVPYLAAFANGETSGALISAGEARGGNAIIGAANGGALRIEGQSEGVGLYMGALGLGGEGPSAAHAFGGAATLFANGGTVVSPYDLEVNADARGGDYAGYFTEFGISSNGFDATGGTASVTMAVGDSGTGLIDLPSLYITAQGYADSGSFVQGSGGIGTGGTAMLEVADGTLDIDFYLGVLANGYGGTADENPEGPDAFASGDGVGGSASFELSGGSVIAPAIGIEAQGYGAGGVGGSEGSIPSFAGHGHGGSATFSASGGTLDNTGFGVESQFYLTASGFGGGGAYNPELAPGGAGGFGTGGTALFEAPAGSTASLAVGGAIYVEADGYGGSGGGSASSEFGPGGDGFGGDALMALADIPFGFGQVGISGSGYGGPSGFFLTDGPSGFAPGEIGSGTGNGGTAGFELVDSGAAAAARTIDQLHIAARGTDFTGFNVNGDGGTTSFVAEVGGADAALGIAGDLLLDASGATAPAGFGFTGSIAGAPVTVGGTATILTPRDAILTITAPGALNVTGDLTIDVGGSFTSTGALSTLANASVIANLGISMTDLSAGGTTLLQALSGPVTVSHDLMSGGLVTVLGTTVDLVSLGALSFADADATAGDLSIETEDDLDLTTVDATGAVTLISNIGTVHNTGAVNGTDLTFIAGVDVISDTSIAANGNLLVDAGGMFVTPDGSASATGNVSLSADLGLDLASVVSGGTTLLQADLGPVIVDSLTSADAVTASGQAVSIVSPGALTFTDAQATAGDLFIRTAGDLTLAMAGATGNIALTSTGGALSGAGPIVAGGRIAGNAATAIALGTATSGDTTSLFATSGPVTATNLNSAGPVSVEGTAVDIGSTGSLTFAELDATAGNVRVQTVGNLAVGAVGATGSITLVSTGGALNASGALNGVGITLSSFADLSLANALSTSGAISLTSTNGSVSATSPVTAGGNLAVSGLTGITLGTASSGGTTSLTAINGAIAVANLASVGAVTASGRSIALGSTGGLAVASAQATAGNLAISTAQGLTVSSAGATGTLALTAGGNLSTTGAISGTGVTLSGANVTAGGPVTSSAALSLTAQQLLTISSQATGTAITATSGDIAIGATGRLGSRGLTQTLRITNQSASAPINFGGTATAGQFSLDGSEATRLFADQRITIAGRASEGDGSNIRIGDLAMSFGTASTANIGSGGTLKVDTAGMVTVVGAVALSTSSAADTFSIDPTRIDVIAGPGSIALLGSGGSPLGALVLEGGTVAVADQAVLDAIGSSSDFAAIRRMLDQPTTTPSDSGFLRAGSIDVFADSGLYIQNTGASTATTARRGFTAGAFNVDTGSSATQIAINGVIIGATGTLTGRLALDAVTINGESAARGGSFDPFSTINGCVIGTSCGSNSVPTHTDLETPVGADDLDGPGQSGTLVQMSDTEPLITPPLVDEPITGVGNDDLWQVHCDPDDGKAGCPSGQGEKVE